MFQDPYLIGNHFLKVVCCAQIMLVMLCWMLLSRGNSVFEILSSSRASPDAVLSCGTLTASLSLEVAIEARGQVHEKGVCLEEDSVARARDDLGDLARSLDSSQIKESRRF